MTNGGGIETQKQRAYEEALGVYEANKARQLYEKGFTWRSVLDAQPEEIAVQLLKVLQQNGLSLADIDKPAEGPKLRVEEVFGEAGGEPEPPEDVPVLEPPEALPEEVKTPAQEAEEVFEEVLYTFCRGEIERMRAYDHKPIMEALSSDEARAKYEWLLRDRGVIEEPSEEPVPARPGTREVKSKFKGYREENPYVDRTTNQELVCVIKIRPDGSEGVYPLRIPITPSLGLDDSDTRKRFYQELEEERGELLEEYGKSRDEADEARIITDVRAHLRPQGASADSEINPIGSIWIGKRRIGEFKLPQDIAKLVKDNPKGFGGTAEYRAWREELPLIGRRQAFGALLMQRMEKRGWRFGEAGAAEEGEEEPAAPGAPAAERRAAQRGQFSGYAETFQEEVLIKYVREKREGQKLEKTRIPTPISKIYHGGRTSSFEEDSSCRTQFLADLTGIRSRVLDNENGDERERIEIKVVKEGEEVRAYLTINKRKVKLVPIPEDKTEIIARAEAGESRKDDNKTFRDWKKREAFDQLDVYLMHRMWLEGWIFQVVPNRYPDLPQNGAYLARSSSSFAVYPDLLAPPAREEEPAEEPVIPQGRFLGYVREFQKIVGKTVITEKRNQEKNRVAAIPIPSSINPRDNTETGNFFDLLSRFRRGILEGQTEDEVCEIEDDKLVINGREKGGRIKISPEIEALRSKKKDELTEKDNEKFKEWEKETIRRQIDYILMDRLWREAEYTFKIDRNDPPDLPDNGEYLALPYTETVRHAIKAVIDHGSDYAFEIAEFVRREWPEDSNARLRAKGQIKDFYRQLFGREGILMIGELELKVDIDKAIEAWVSWILDCVFV